MENQLRKVQMLQFDLACTVKRLCENNDLSYYLIAGTLLGAVRHQGFIPWDDDLDIGMPREDYDRFLEICKTQLDHNKYFLQDWNTDPGYGLCFAKLRLNGTEYLEKTAKHIEAHKGIYIDIFPFDHVPKELSARKKHRRMLYFLHRLYLSKLGYEVWEDGDVIKRLVYGGLRIIASFCSKDRLKETFEKEMRRYNDIETEEIVAVGGSYGYERETIRKEWVSHTVMMPFESGEMACPAAYEDYLTKFYGDYMTPPPESQRENRHQILKVDFGPYDVEGESIQP